MTRSHRYPQPPSRRLQIYSFDPALAARYDLAGTSIVAIDVRWEENLSPGPVGEYIEVVDIDPASSAAYPPVDLNAPELLATDGLAPSESDPRFHQQMVYAVTMRTIENFERALGRKVLWASHLQRDGAGNVIPGPHAEQYVPRLRIYPHAMKQKNAYYSPQKKALLFGYFASTATDGRSTPGTNVFTCLSHDIIAHETTHALLDGVHPRFTEPVNMDVLAFHEAFADIVALLQHFSYPGVLRDQLARVRGDILRESTLGQIAQQFALASGRGGALRSYLGSKDKHDVWRPMKADPFLLEKTTEPHDRGAILVAAVFGAFMKVYTARTRDLFRIASNGTGVMPQGDIHPDLVNRLAEEAERCADRALQMAIRAIDYCPPVGITFGAYLRAIVTADHDMNLVDKERWRLAFIESFREWGIAPRDCRSIAEDSLLWPSEDEVIAEQVETGASTPDEKSRSPQRVVEATDRGRRAMYSIKTKRLLEPVSLAHSRLDTWRDANMQAARFHDHWLQDEDATWLADCLGLVVVGSNLPATIFRAHNGMPSIEVHSVRTAMKRGALGWPEPHMVIVLTQRRAGFLDEAQQAEMDRSTLDARQMKLDFRYRAGCTLLVEPDSMQIRRVIRTPGTISDDIELARMRRYLRDGLEPPDAFRGAAARFEARAEPFAFLHAHGGH